MVVAYDEMSDTPFQLMDLPDEILVSIISSLDFDSLLHAIHVNRHFHALAEPFLYESVTVLHGNKALDLSDALATNRSRAEWIRSLLISTKFGQEHALFKLPQFIRSMRNVQDLRLETPDCNTKRPEDRVFWIQLQDRYEQIFEQSSLDIPDPRSRLLPNLKTCVLHFVDNNTELYSLSRYAAIFLHPTLKSLTVSCMSTDIPQRLFPNLRNVDINSLKRSTALESLHLEECDIHPPSLELILSLPRALKTLKISEGIRYDGLFRAGSSRVHGNMKPHPFAEALVRTCKDSLESLSLSLGYFRSHHHNINHTGQHLRLHELESLKHLEVNNRTLNLIRHRPGCDHNTWKRLPKSLETFKVFGVPLMQPPHNTQQPYVPLDPCIIRDKVHHGVPNLKTIIYTYEHYDTVDDNEMNFNDLILNLVYNNDANGHHANPLVDLVQQGAGVGNAAPLQPVPVQQPQPVHAPAAPNFITAPLTHLDAPAQNQNPPHFRWQTGSRRSSAATELSRGDAAKFSLLSVINDSILPHFEQTQTRLQIDLVTLPRGFIPPYLFPEDKPRVREAWFDSRKPRTAQAFLDSVRRKQARRNAAAQAAAAAYAASSSASSSPSPVDRNLGLGFGMAAVSERVRSRNLFIRRLRQGHLDDELLADGTEMRLDDSSDSDSDGADSAIMDEDDEMEVEDILEMLAGEAAQGSMDFNSSSEHTEDDASTGTDTASEGGSVYVDAETEVEMTDAGSLDSSSSSDGDF